jgi:chlorite dismutase
VSSRMLSTFVGGRSGQWRIERSSAVVGLALPTASHLAIFENEPGTRALEQESWVLRGVTSYERYVHATEQARLIAIQPPLQRPQATQAALIPVKKSADWWRLPQDRRRAIFEERSQHITLGLRYLPAIARRLYHGHDLGEPFDFLTWFEYAPADAEAFEELVQALRRTEEWTYVEREVDLRLTKRA